ncbi:hypothetical protein L3X38_017780 [Prunus dulcis]|uniref:Uncharacterized protein n=1 Tax=Prunus dulcis TaxID=3755 RepID=A0AAD4W9J7_PRUDU|nr:hypothetical protein L3X38_017780 [Prunus dulcis]
MWDFVQVAVVVTLVLEIRFGGRELRQSGASAGVCRFGKVSSFGRGKVWQLDQLTSKGDISELRPPIEGRPVPLEPPHFAIPFPAHISLDAFVVAGNRYETGRFRKFLIEFRGALSDTFGHHFFRIWIGVWAGGLEYFWLPKIDQATHTLPARVAERGLHSEVTLSPRMILMLSRACRNSRISIWATFEPRLDLAYCAISGFITFEPLDRSYSCIYQSRQFLDCVGFNGSGIEVPDTPKRPILGLGLRCQARVLAIEKFCVPLWVFGMVLAVPQGGPLRWCRSARLVKEKTFEVLATFSKVPIEARGGLEQSGRTIGVCEGGHGFCFGGVGRTGFGLSSLGEVVHGDNCVLYLAFAFRHRSDEVQSPLGKWLRTDLGSQWFIQELWDVGKPLAFIALLGKCLGISVK